LIIVDVKGTQCPAKVPLEIHIAPRPSMVAVEAVDTVVAVEMVTTLAPDRRPAES
jgi:hypothetical protein